jgi:hypothetical protein
MTPLVRAILIAVVYFAFAAWASYEGWHRHWSTNALMLRAAGVMALLAGIYALVRGRRP